MRKLFDKILLSTALVGLSLIPPLPLCATTLATMPPSVALPVAPLPDLPPVSDPVSTLTKVGTLGETCAVYLLTHATGTQIIVVCTEADGSTQVTMPPACGG